MDNPKPSKEADELQEQMRKVYINRDMTQEERAIEYHLRVMLAEKIRKVRKGSTTGRLGEESWLIR